MSTDGVVTRYERVTGEVVITGVGSADHTAASGRTTKDIAAQAIARALDDAGLTPHDVDGIMYHPMGDDQFDENDFRRYFGTTHDMWVSREGGGMRWAATAPYEAALAIREGKARHVVNCFAVAWATQRADMVGGPGQAHAENLMKQNLEVPFGLFPQPVYAATMARRHMIEYGTTERQLGAIATTMRSHANRTIDAVMRDRAMTIDDYLASPMLAEPLRKFDCCLISDGGGAYVISDAHAVAASDAPRIEVAGVAHAVSPHGAFFSQKPDITTTDVAAAAPAAYAMAGIEASDLDVLTCYDPFTILALMVVEDLGVCAKGEGGLLAERGMLCVDGGSLPLNPHGGLLSHAYVLGIAHVVELVRQLRGTADAQVPDARIGVYAASIGAEAATLVLRRSR